MISFTEEAVVEFDMRAWVIHLQEGTEHTGLLQHCSPRDIKGAHFGAATGQLEETWMV